MITFHYDYAYVRGSILGFRVVRTIETVQKSIEKDFIEMVEIPGKDYKMSTTEITQGIYESVMGENPSYFKGENNPVESASWYDAIYFCNKLSEKCGYTPVYSVGGTTDVTKWNYTPHQKDSIYKDITQNTKADGFRLPTEAEWEYAAKGGQNYKYAGSDNIDEVAWYSDNSGETTHSVAQKKANGYGLYDMSGNVSEWCWDSNDSGFRCIRGGSWHGLYSALFCTVSYGNVYGAYNRYSSSGFRVVRTAKSTQKSAEKKNVKGKEPIEMVQIPGQNYKMSTTEITQKFYESIMGTNPSYFNGENNPVEMVSWYDAIYFCNKLSKKCGYTPVYSVGGTTDVTKWNYTPHQVDEIYEEITQNTSANGFRLPTNAEWGYAAKGGQNYKYAGSNNIDEVAWYWDNSGETTHSVAQKKANGYGLYDMSGNVWEWCWDSNDSGYRYLRGGSWCNSEDRCTVSYGGGSYAYYRGDSGGFRVVRTAESTQKSAEKKNVKGKEPIEMVNIPGQNYKMSKTEITQKFYESIMGTNPSKFKVENNPVESVSWYDAIYFCNKLSEKCGYTPVYSVGGTTDVTKWNYTPHQEDSIYKDITQNISANGFRLPTNAEWEYAAKGGQNYTYAGSNNIDEVAWYEDNSGRTTHPVAQKKANGYGLYDMSGNVCEWCWDSFFDSGSRYWRCGSWSYSADSCTVSSWLISSPSSRGNGIGFGFRVVRTAD